MVNSRRYTLVALLLTAAIAGLTWSFGARAAGGADSYGYASQADAWLRGTLEVQQPWVHNATPPFSERAFAPLGWKLRTDTSIVPLYSPGYPLMMAGAKLLFGHGAMFAVVPACAGLLVFATYLLGVRIGRRGAGLLAAAFVATSASVLYMSVMPMSDVPSAALWTLALACALGDSRRSAVVGGAIAGLAILTRPNLAPLAAIMTAWIALRDWRALGASLLQWRAPLFVIGTVAGAAFNAYLNARLFGSAMTSGYGSLSSFYEWAHVLPNIKNYLSWLADAESPVALLALAGVIVPIAFVRAGGKARAASWLFAASAFYVFAVYQPYLVFESWWYLRFLLTLWPLMALALALTLGLLWEAKPKSHGPVVLLAAAVMVHGVHYASQHYAFNLGLTESRYPQIARAVAGVTDPSAAIITVQHSGTLRYYGGRVTVRYDFIESGQLDEAIQFFRAQGHKPYLLLDAFEVAAMRERFPDSKEIGTLSWTPVITFFGGETMLFDLDDRTRDLVTSRTGAYTRRSVLPVAPPHW